MGGVSHQPLQCQLCVNPHRLAVETMQARTILLGLSCCLLASMALCNMMGGGLL